VAERRMFAKKITDDDKFLSLSSSAQALYLHLSMSADDDGFTNQIATSMFRAHASTNDLEALLQNRYIYQFESGVIVIKDWRMANALRKDRYSPTIFRKELSMLRLDNNGSYIFNSNGIPVANDVNEIADSGCRMVAGRLPQDSIGKVSIVEDSIDNINNISTNNNKKKNKNITTSTFKPPTVQDVTEYCLTNGLTYVNPEAFIDFYESKNWMVGKNKMSKWKSALSGWNRRAKERGEKEFHIVPETPQHDDRPERWKTCPDSLWQKLKPYAHDDGSFDWPDFDTSVLTPEDREWMRRNDM